MPAALTPSRRRLLLAAWALLCAGLGVRAFTGGILAAAPSGPGPWTPACVDVNRAGIAELCTLPGIGEKRAEAIVLHRVRHGWFAAVEDLGAVDGIGPDTVAQLAPHACASRPPAPTGAR